MECTLLGGEQRAEDARCRTCTSRSSLSKLSRLAARSGMALACVVSRVRAAPVWLSTGQPSSSKSAAPSAWACRRSATAMAAPTLPAAAATSAGVLPSSAASPQAEAPSSHRSAPGRRSGAADWAPLAGCALRMRQQAARAQTSARPSRLLVAPGVVRPKQGSNCRHCMMPGSWRWLHWAVVGMQADEGEECSGG